MPKFTRAIRYEHSDKRTSPNFRKLWVAFFQSAREKRPMSTAAISGQKSSILSAKTLDSKKGGRNVDHGARKKKTKKPKSKPLTKLDIESKFISVVSFFVCSLRF